MPTRIVGAHPMDRAPVVPDLARRDPRPSPAISRSRVRLAGTVRTDDGDGLALVDLQVEIRTAPGSRRSGCLTASISRRLKPTTSVPEILGMDLRVGHHRAGSPSASLRPELVAMSRSTTAISACTTCSIQMIVTPSDARRADGRRRARRPRVRSVRRRSRRGAADEAGWRARGRARAACDRAVSACRPDDWRDGSSPVRSSAATLRGAGQPQSPRRAGVAGAPSEGVLEDGHPAERAAGSGRCARARVGRGRWAGSTVMSRPSSRIARRPAGGCR